MSAKWQGKMGLTFTLFDTTVNESCIKANAVINHSYRDFDLEKITDFDLILILSQYMFTSGSNVYIFSSSNVLSKNVYICWYAHVTRR